MMQQQGENFTNKYGYYKDKYHKNQTKNTSKKLSQK